MLRPLFFLLISFLFFRTVFASAPVDTINAPIEADVIENPEQLVEFSTFFLNSDPRKSIIFSRKALTLHDVSDEKRASVYFNLGKAYFFTGDYDSALSNYDHSLKIYEGLNFLGKIASVHQSIGAILIEENSNSEKAVIHYEKAGDIYNRLGNKENLAQFNINMGTLFCLKDDYEKALSECKKAQIYFRESGNRSGIVRLLFQMGGIYNTWGDHDAALDIYLRALSTTDKNTSIHQKGRLYACIGRAYALMNDLDSALIYVQKGYDIWKRLDNKPQEMKTLIDLGNLIYLRGGGGKKARLYYEQSLKFAEEILDSFHIAMNLANIGAAYYDDGKEEIALKYMLKSLEIAERNDFNRLKITRSFNLYQIYVRKKKYKEALNYYTDYAEGEKKLFTERSRERIEELNIKMDTERKKDSLRIKDIELHRIESEVKYKTRINYFLLAALGFVLLAVLIILRVYYLKRKSNKMLLLKTSDLIKANQELEKLSIIAKDTDNSVMILSPDSNIEWVNNGFTYMSGYTLEEYKKIFGDKLINADSNPKIKDYFAKCTTTKKSVIYTTEILTKWNSKIKIQMALTPILGEHDNVQKIIAIGMDITKLTEVADVSDEGGKKKIEELINSSAAKVQIEQAIDEADNQKLYAKRFLINKGSALIPVNISDIACFYTQNDNVFLRNYNNEEYVLNYVLDEVIKRLDPKHFYRANRQYIISINAIKKINYHDNKKLKVELVCRVEDVIISRLKATEFKNWVKTEN